MEGVRNLKGIVLAGLMKAQKLISAAGGEGGIVPQFRIMTPEGDYWLSMELADDPHERRAQLHRLSQFMAWKAAQVFTLACELADPDAVYCLGATRESQILAISAIERDPIRFGTIEWLVPDQREGEIVTLLACGDAELDAAGVAELGDYFGALGKYPAVRLGDGAAK